jgi:MFS superfamily sulfate permease-like transporter
MKTFSFLAMANATTANLPPINGLYVAFFSVVAYLFFGTSKHLSLG